MSSQTPQEADKKSRKIASSKVEKGKELEAWQQGQNELLSIQAQQKQLLMEQQMQDRAAAGQMDVMKQAAELGVMSGGGPVVAQQVAQMNPQTQAMLQKYGMGKPRVQATQGRDVKVAPNHITINNNTTTKTTNNVTVAGQPAGNRPLVVNQQGGGNGGGTAAKFKAWISNVFNRQREESAVREKTYQRREWSLSKSANRMMRSLEKIGKTFASRLDPRKLANTQMSTLKTIFFTLGLANLQKWWPKLLGIVDSIQTFFMGKPGEDGNQNKSFFERLGEGFKKAMGGSESETFGESFKRLFWNPSGEGGGGIFDQLLEELKYYLDFSGRFKALSELKFPDIKGPTTDPLVGAIGTWVSSAVKGLAEYLKCVFTTMFTGNVEVPDMVVKPVQFSTAKNELEAGEKMNNKAYGRDTTFKNNKDLAQGDVGVVYKKEGGSYQGLDSRDLDGDMQLRSGAAHSLRQGYSLVNSIRDKKNANTFEILQGLDRLDKAAAREEDGVPVAPLFFDALSELGLDGEKYKKASKLGSYKFVIRDRTAEDQYDMSSYALENMDTFIGDGSNMMAGDYTKRGYSAGQYYRRGIASAIMNPAAAITTVTGMALTESPDAQGWADKKNSKLSKKIIKLVPASSKEQGVDMYGNKSDKTFGAYQLTPEIMNQLKADIGALAGVKGEVTSFGMKENPNLYKNFDSFVVNKKLPYKEGEAEEYARSRRGGSTSDAVLESKKKALEKYKKAAEKEKAEGDYDKSRRSEQRAKEAQEEIDEIERLRKERKEEYLRKNKPKSSYDVGRLATNEAEKQILAYSSFGKVQEKASEADAEYERRRAARRAELDERAKNLRGVKGAQYVVSRLSEGYNAIFGDGEASPEVYRYGNIGNISAPRQLLVNTARSYLNGNSKGNLRYSQTKRNYLEGSDDCSGFHSHLYKNVLGMNISDGSEGMLVSSAGHVVDWSGGIKRDSTGTGNKPNFNLLKPGDLLYYRRPHGIKRGSPFGVGHVAMYMGINEQGVPQELSMGGDPGPYLVNASTYDHYKDYIGAKSYIEDDSISETDGNAGKFQINSSEASNPMPVVADNSDDDQEDENQTVGEPLPPAQPTATSAASTTQSSTSASAPNNTSTSTTSASNNTTASTSPVAPTTPSSTTTPASSTPQSSVPISTPSTQQSSNSTLPSIPMTFEEIEHLQDMYSTITKGTNFYNPNTVNDIITKASGEGVFLESANGRMIKAEGDLEKDIRSRYKNGDTFKYRLMMKEYDQLDNYGDYRIIIRGSSSSTTPIPIDNNSTSQSTTDSNFNSGNISQELGNIAYTAEQLGIPGIESKFRGENSELRRKADYIFDQLKAAFPDWSDEAIAGVVGCLYGESGLDEHARNGTGISSARGIAQWCFPARLDAFKEKYHHDVADGTFEEQVEFMISEMKSNGFSTFRNKMSNCNSAAEGARITMGYYEHTQGFDQALQTERKNHADAGIDPENVNKNAATRQYVGNMYLAVRNGGAAGGNYSSGVSLGSGSSSSSLSSSGSSSSGGGFVSKVLDKLGNLWKTLKEGFKNWKPKLEARWEEVPKEEGLAVAKRIAEAKGIPGPESLDDLVPWLNENDPEHDWQRVNSNETPGEWTLRVRPSNKHRELNGNETYSKEKKLKQEKIDQIKKRIDPKLIEGLSDDEILARYEKGNIEGYRWEGSKLVPDGSLKKIETPKPVTVKGPKTDTKTMSAKIMDYKAEQEKRKKNEVVKEKTVTTVGTNICNAIYGLAKVTAAGDKLNAEINNKKTTSSSTTTSSENKSTVHKPLEQKK